MPRRQCRLRDDHAVDSRASVRRSVAGSRGILLSETIDNSRLVKVSDPSAARDRYFPPPVAGAFHCHDVYMLGSTHFPLNTVPVSKRRSRARTLVK